MLSRDASAGSFASASIAAVDCQNGILVFWLVVFWLVVYAHSVFTSLASTGGWTEGPGAGVVLAAWGGGAEAAGVRVVALGGERVGYLRALAPAVLAAFEEAEPMIGRAVGLRIVELQVVDNVSGWVDKTFWDHVIIVIEASSPLGRDDLGLV